MILFKLSTNRKGEPQYDVEARKAQNYRYNAATTNPTPRPRVTVAICNERWQAQRTANYDDDAVLLSPRWY